MNPGPPSSLSIVRHVGRWEWRQRLRFITRRYQIVTRPTPVSALEWSADALTRPDENLKIMLVFERARGLASVPRYRCQPSRLLVTKRKRIDSG